MVDLAKERDLLLRHLANGRPTIQLHCPTSYNLIVQLKKFNCPMTGLFDGSFRRPFP